MQPSSNVCSHLRRAIASRDTEAMNRAGIFTAAVLTALLAFAGCGDEPQLTISVETDPPAEDAPAAGDPGSPTVPGDAEAEDVRVIVAWSEALGKGDVEAAADYFAIPSVAENGPALLRIRNPGQARLFNASLPCGAEVIRAESQGAFTTATFRLSERPGEGFCGIGSGEATAETSFVIEDGKIAEWRRVDTIAPEPPPEDVV